MSVPLPYGPHTDAVRRLLQRLAAAPAESWADAARRYEALARTPRYAAAERALAQAIADAGRERERDAVVGPLVQIAADAAERVARLAPAPPATAPTTAAADADAAGRFAEPALAAALAVVMRDLLGREEFAALFEGVAGMVEEKELGPRP
jgi:hypothetical protein